MGAGTRLYRVAGTAVDGGRRPVDWSTVVKVLTLDQLNFQSISTDQSSWDYWKREWHVYQSAWLQELPGPLVAPRCLATGEVLTETDQELAWIAMEDLCAADHGPWPADHFREVARHVGIFNGDHLDGRPMPVDPWLSHDWLRGWTEQAEPLMEQLPRVASHPVAGRIFTPDLIDDLMELWIVREKLFEALDQLPQTLCHNDVFPRNLFVRGNSRPEQSVAIDWAFCGHAPVGQELQCWLVLPRGSGRADRSAGTILNAIALTGTPRAFDRRAGKDPTRSSWLPSVDRPPFRHRRCTRGTRANVDHGAPRFVERVFGCPYDAFIGIVPPYSGFSSAGYTGPGHFWASEGIAGASPSISTSGGSGSGH